MRAIALTLLVTAAASSTLAPRAWRGAIRPGRAGIRRNGCPAADDYEPRSNRHGTEASACPRR